MVEAHDDRLAELEAVVRDFFLSRGFKREEDQVEGDLKWGFMVDISSIYKEKELSIKLIKVGKNGNSVTTIYADTHKTTEEMFSRAIELFRDELEEDVPANEAPDINLT